MVDGGVGSIVWVRRRNGSWWPGKILGPHELSASHLMSPRSGTPVKLLGREDASVDWYNLEKSKRVKAFRCGEFSDFIQRAEASQSMPPKKREKYARREDAVLHALELERQLLGKKYGGSGCSSTNRSNKSADGFSKRESRTSSRYLGNENGRFSRSKSRQLPHKPGFFLEEKCMPNSTSVEKPRNANQFSGDDDNSNVPPRMRGLQDLCLDPPSVASENAGQLVVCRSANAISDGSCTERLVNFGRKRLLDKRKLCEEGLADEIHAKRRDRRTCLTQVLESSEDSPVSLPMPDSGTVLGVAKKSVCNMADEPRESLKVEESNDAQVELSTLKSADNSSHPAELCEQNASATTDFTDIDSSETDSMESDSDDDLATLSDGAASIELEPKYIRICEAQTEHGSMSSEEMSELALADDTCHTSQHESISAAFGVSKWQMKGKRNNRSNNKRTLDHFNLNRAPHIARRNMFNWADWAWDDLPASRGYWEEPIEYYDPVNSYRHSGGRTMLIDVDLKVQSSYQRVQVPMISMTSKINGQAIVGYPIQVEALSNGSYESLLDHNFPEASDNDTALPPAWRTARRTANVRIPRTQASSELDSPEGINHNVPKVNVLESVVQKGSTTRKTTTFLPATERTFSRKPGKMISLSSYQKVRTLSSIASQQKHSDLKGSSYSNQVDGVIKTEELPTVVACIPVKLVFSRLNEELVGRHQ